MKTLILLLVGQVGLVAQTVPVTQTIFTAQTSAATVTISARGQATHALTVVFQGSAANVTDFDIRLEGSFDSGVTWIPITADLTSAASNSIIAAATVRANGIYPRIRANLVTPSAKPMQAYYVGSAGPVIDGFVFGGASSGSPSGTGTTSCGPGTVLAGPPAGGGSPGVVTCRAIGSGDIGTLDYTGSNVINKPLIPSIAGAGILIGSLGNAVTNPSLLASLFPVFLASGGAHAPGLVPDPGATPGTTRFLREDGIFALPPVGGGSSTCVYQGYWNSATAYPVGSDSCDTVLYGAAPSSMYQSIAASTNVIPGTDATKWQQVGYLIPLRYRGAYASGTTYVPQDVVTSLGSSFISLSTSTGQTPPDPFSFPGGNAFWGIIASGSSGTATPSLAVSASPSSRTLVRGSTTTYTVTLTAVALSGATTPTVTGLPSGVTAAFSPATVPSTGGSTTATLTASSSATVATQTITFTGTSGATTGSGTATLITDTPATFLTSTAPATSPAPHAISASNLDWAAFALWPSTTNSATTTNDRKSGGALIGTPVPGPGGCGDNQLYYTTVADGQDITWTNGTIASTGSMRSGVQAGGACTVQIPVTLPADTLAHTVSIIYYTNGGPSSDSVTTVANISDGSTSDLTVVDNTLSGNALDRFITFSVRASTPSAVLRLRVTPSNTGAFVKAVEVVN